MVGEMEVWMPNRAQSVSLHYGYKDVQDGTLRISIWQIKMVKNIEKYRNL